jgi:hypothetical protein
MQRLYIKNWMHQADWIDLANTTMNLEEMITDGRVHICVLKSVVIPNPNEDEEEIALPVIIEDFE